MPVTKTDNVVALLDGEEWKPITGMEGYYEVSNMGRVRSIDRQFDRKNGTRYSCKGSLLSLKPDGSGYVRLALFKGKKYKVHHLVIREFGPPKPEIGKWEIHHKNHIRTDNRIENLEWVSHAANYHACLNVGQRKDIIMTPFKVRLLRASHARGLNTKDLAKAFSCSAYSVWSIVSMRSWTWVR